MARYPRLKNEHIQPVDAPIPRAKARELLIDYLVQVTRWPRSTADHSAFEFDMLADEHDQRLDEAFDAATSNASLELEMASDEVADISADLGREASASEVKALEADLRNAEKRLARYKAIIDKAEAKRSAGKSDYRKLLLKAANKIVSEEERM
jgi:primosomal protein N''